DHIALSGQAPDGFTEITSTGRNFADNGITNEFVDGRYAQILAGGDNHALGFETTTTNAYESTKWNITWRASVAAPTGQLLRVGTF
ncbi:hypothetical protein ACM6L2_19100, partial [Paenibacillus larvae]|uniref:hypothetical protein n=1 Tax=Paenibacillus larvae TaxID=1464 RepID=UPI0039FC4BF6